MRYLALALCLLLIVPVNVIAQQEEGTAVLSVDAFERADYFDLIEKDDLLNMLSCIVIIANTEGRQLLLVEGRSGLLPLDDDNFSFRDALAVWLRAWNE